MIDRIAQHKLISLSQQFKIVGVIGPRQTGKTTLVKAVFSRHPYVNLENIDMRKMAIDDPRAFLSRFKEGAIIDEAQRAPELFSYLQEIVDNSGETGLFILSGSNNFLLQEQIAQSLAGRIGYIELLPFNQKEVNSVAPLSLDQTLIKGGYPPLYDQPIEPALWFNNYVRTYIERDVRQIKSIANLTLFERFVRLCAGRVGQLVNMRNLANETGIDDKTVNAWLSVLEAGFVVFRLPPYYKNFNKRVIKMPKLYFYDTGLVAFLLGIKDEVQLSTHSMRGALFENWCITEAVKAYTNLALRPPIFFWRDHSGHEIDLIIENGNELNTYEIKSAATFHKQFAAGFKKWDALNKGVNTVIYGGEDTFDLSSGVKIRSWQHLENVWPLS